MFPPPREVSDIDWETKQATQMSAASTDALPLVQARQQVSAGVSRILELPADCFDQRASSAFGIFSSGINKACETYGDRLHEIIADIPQTLEEKRTGLSFLVEIHERKELYQKQVNQLIWQMLQNPSWRSAGLDGSEELCNKVHERMIQDKFQSC
jgi:hypothetical protein